MLEDNFNRVEQDLQVMFICYMLMPRCYIVIGFIVFQVLLQNRSNDRTVSLRTRREPGARPGRRRGRLPGRVRPRQAGRRAPHLEGREGGARGVPSRRGRTLRTVGRGTAAPRGRRASGRLLRQGSALVPPSSTSWPCSQPIFLAPNSVCLGFRGVSKDLIRAHTLAVAQDCDRVSVSFPRPRPTRSRRLVRWVVPVRAACWPASSRGRVPTMVLFTTTRNRKRVCRSSEKFLGCRKRLKQKVHVLI